MEHNQVKSTLDMMQSVFDLFDPFKQYESARDKRYREANIPNHKWFNRVADLTWEMQDTASDLRNQNDFWEEDTDSTREQYETYLAKLKMQVSELNALINSYDKECGK